MTARDRAPFSQVGYRLGAWLLVAIVLWSRPMSAQQTSEQTVVRGRVVDPDGRPVALVIVTAGTIDGSQTGMARTDTTGRYRISLPRVVVGVRVDARHPGFAAQERLVTRLGGDTTDLIADFRLAVPRLAAVRTVAPRPRPAPMALGRGFNPGETGAMVIDPADDVTGGLQGDLASSLSAVPGLSVIPDATGGVPTITLAGLSSDLNLAELQGVGFGGSLPRDGALLRVYTSSYDPAKSMAGVLASWTVLEGSYLPQRELRLTLDHPTLQRASPLGARRGQQYQLPIVSGRVAGVLPGVSRRYSTTFQFSRRTTDAVTLLTADPRELAGFAISPDSVARLVGALGAMGLAPRVTAAPGDPTTSRGAVAFRLDLTRDMEGTVTYLPAGQGVSLGYVMNPPDRRVYLIGTGDWSRTRGAQLWPTAVPGVGAEADHWNAGIQLFASSYLRGAVLNETRSSVSWGAQRTAPTLELPNAMVQIRSELPDGTRGVAAVQVAGSGRGRTDLRRWAWGASNETRWSTRDDRHEFKVVFDGMLDRYKQVEAPGSGTLRYLSIADFVDDAPSSFTRTLTTTSREGFGWHGALGVGDVYEPSRRFGMQYGVRAEGQWFGARPAVNPLINSLFGRRTDRLPSALAIAPMAGFTWNYRMRPNGYPAPGTSLVGGIRNYRGLLGTFATDPFRRETGLPSATQQLACVGDAVPIPTWTTWLSDASSVPSRCADGSAGTPSVQGSPNVALFAPKYTPSASWRANLTWTHALSDRLSVSAHGMAADNRTQLAPVDVNFTGAVRFTLPEEGHRPVFVRPSSIIPATGTSLPQDSRRHAQFALVQEYRATLRSTAHSLGFGLRYAPRYRGFESGLKTVFNASYVFAGGRTQATGFGDAAGFGGTTAGDPRIVTWAPAAMSRHTLLASGSLVVPTWFTLSAGLQLRSGVAYTPVVSGDVNGDGLWNDRAFVFDPMRTADQDLAQQMGRLLAEAPPTAGDCLRRQWNAVAGLNSCRAPWSQSLNLSLALDAQRLRMQGRGDIRLHISNALALVDQLAHGPSRMRGWGQPALPDATLLLVQGYNPAEQRYQYAVNPQFGSTSVVRALTAAPFRITLDVRLNLGPDHVRRWIRGYSTWRSGDSVEVLDPDVIHQQLLRNIPPHTFDRLVQLRDTLALSAAQIDSLNAIGHRYEQARDSIYAALAAVLSRGDGRTVSASTRRRYLEAIRDVALVEWRLAPAVRAVLTPEQLRRAFISQQLRLAALTMDEREVRRFFGVRNQSP